MKTFIQFMREARNRDTEKWSTTAGSIKQDHRLDMAALVSQVMKRGKELHPDADPKAIEAWKKKHEKKPK